MEPIRIIPRLDIKGPNLVKGIQLEGLRVLVKPEDFAQYYYANGADELMFVDVVASLYQRNSLHEIIKKTAKKIFVPLTVSGGVRTIDDIKNVLRAGADKVSLNTAAINNPELIKKASREFGSSTIVITIEAIKQPGKEDIYYAYTDNGREHTGLEVSEWAAKVEELGAGEIVITSVDNEGTGLGFDLQLTEKISQLVNIPIVAHGGCGKISDISSAAKKTKVNAVALSSILHYNVIEKLSNQDNQKRYQHEGNTEFLSSGKKSQHIEVTDITKLKNSLSEQNIYCRI